MPKLFLRLLWQSFVDLSRGFMTARFAAIENQLVDHRTFEWILPRLLCEVYAYSRRMGESLTRSRREFNLARMSEIRVPIRRVFYWLKRLTCGRLPLALVCDGASLECFFAWRRRFRASFTKAVNLTILFSSFTKESALVLSKAMCPGRKALFHPRAHNYWQIVAVRE